MCGSCGLQGATGLYLHHFIHAHLDQKCGVLQGMICLIVNDSCAHLDQEYVVCRGVSGCPGVACGAEDGSKEAFWAHEARGDVGQQGAQAREG